MAKRSSNTSKTREKTIYVNPFEEIEAFDSLPPRIRQYLACTSLQVSALSVKEHLDKGMSEESIMARLDVQNQRIKQEYYQRLESGEL